VTLSEVPLVTAVLVTVTPEPETDACAPSTNPLPVTVRVTSVAPCDTAAGETEETTMAGGGVATVNVTVLLVPTLPASSACVACTV
jgi:hypothetical protein